LPHYASLPGEPISEPVRPPPTDILEVWFSGGHSDIGGGNYPNSNEVTLADITLRWMVREIVKAQTGILFDNRALQEAGISSSCFPVTSFLSTPRHSTALETVQEKSNGLNGVGHAKINGKETTSSTDAPDENQKQDAKDAVTPINDALKQKPIWWLVEILPFPVSWQDEKGIWRRKWR
jgi:hypothetical protein